MAKRPSLITSSTNYSNVNALNQNWQKIVEAFDNTLSLDGSTPNALNADLDLNGNSLLNVGTVDAENLTLNGESFTDEIATAKAAADTATDAAETAQGIADGFGDLDTLTSDMQAQVDLAQGYAQTAEDVSVPGGSGYSALHYAAKADASAAASASSAGVAAASETSAATSAATATTAAANAQASALTCATWTELSALTGATAGTGAEVIDTDTGTHTDPVVGGTVSNAGRYTWSASPAGWKRIGGTGLSGKASASEFASLSFDAVRKSTVGSPVVITQDADFAEIVIDENRRKVRGTRLDGYNWMPLLEADKQRFGRAGARVEGSSDPRYLHTAIDQNGNVLPISVMADGKRHPDVIRMEAGQAALLYPVYVARGDSLTAGAFGGSSTYPDHLSTMVTSRIVHRRAYPGESAASITARQGATPLLVTVTGGVIPASGSVGVTLSQSVYTSANEDQNVPDGKVLRGWLAGIECEISGDGGSYQLTRVRSGTQKSVPAGLPFIDAWEQRHRVGTAQLLWIGRNGYGMSVLDYVAASVKFHLGPTLVLGVTTALTETAGTGAHTTITALNFALGQQYGARFFDVRAWLMSDGLAAVGITPTANDLSDIAAGTIPRGLFAADGIHFNADGYHAIAIGVFQKLQYLGWEA